jgi:hypothetical protein
VHSAVMRTGLTIGEFAQPTQLNRLARLPGFPI